MAPGGGEAVSPQLHDDIVIGQRPVLAGGHVVLAGPDQLDRLAAGLLGDVGALDDIVRVLIGPPAERAAGEQGLDLHRAGQGPDHLGDVQLIQGLDLRGEGQLDRIALHLGDAVHRLHGGVGQEREVVGGAEDVAAEGVGRVALGLEGLGLDLGRPLAGGDLLVFGQDDVGAALFGLVVVPGHLERVAALAGGEGVLGRDRHAGGDLEHVDHAGHLLGGGRVERLHLAAEAGRMGDHGHQHAGQLDVLGVTRRPRGLGQAVLAPHPVGADQGEGLGVLERRVLGRLDLGRVGQQLGEAGRLAALGVGDHPVLDGQVAGLGAEPRGGGLDEHRPRPGAGLAQLVPGIVDGGGAAGALNPHQGVAVELGVGRRFLDLDLAPVGVELLGDDGGEAGVVALAHLLVLGDHRHPAVGADLDERAEGAVDLLRAQAEDVGRRAADQQAAADHGGADDQAAAGRGGQVGWIDGSVHVRSSAQAAAGAAGATPAASLIAARMR